MRVLSWGEFERDGLPSSGSAITVGVFDGVHRGHRELLRRVGAQNAAVVARGHGFPRLDSVVVSFCANPRRVLCPHKPTFDITSLDEKIALFEREGLQYCILIDFDRAFAALPGGHFLRLLREKAQLCYLVIGHDFRCGCDNLSAPAIQAFMRSLPPPPPTCEIIPPVMDGGLPVSSSRIRAALSAGDTALAARLLGRELED